MTDRQRGIIAKWFDEKGYGFISPSTGSPDVFFHISSIKNSLRRDLLGQRVTYQEGWGNNGKPAATEVYLATGDETPVYKPKRYVAKSRRSSVFAWGFSGIFFLVLADLAVIKLMPWPVIAIYGGMSALTYWVYVGDKLKAELNAWRTPEATLHWLELLGGWPGALVAQWQIGHKNRKATYQIAFWFIVLLHITALAVMINKTTRPEHEISPPSHTHNPDIKRRIR